LEIDPNRTDFFSSIPTAREQGVIGETDVRCKSAQDVEKLADVVFTFERMFEPLLSIDGVEVPTSLFANFEDLVCHQLGEDALDGSLGNADLIGEVSNAGIGLARQAYNNVEVVGQVSPLGRAGGGVLRTHQ